MTMSGEDPRWQNLQRGCPRWKFNFGKVSCSEAVRQDVLYHHRSAFIVCVNNSITYDGRH